MNYRKLTRLTPLELKMMLDELDGKSWTVPRIKKCARREVVHVRVAPALNDKIELTTKFEWSEAAKKMPFTMSVMRRISLMLSGMLEDIGTGYYARMQPGDAVEDHVDTGVYYQRSWRVQVMLQKPKASRFVVGGELIETEVGDCIIFANSTQVHSIHVDDGERIVLLFDVRKPSWAQ